MEPTTFYVDAQNVLTLTHNLVSSKATRHIARRDMIVREKEYNGIVKVTKIGTKDNLADLFTKVLDRVPFESLRRGVMNLVRTGVVYLSSLPADARLPASDRPSPIGGCSPVWSCTRPSTPRGYLVSVACVCVGAR